MSESTDPQSEPASIPAAGKSPMAELWSIAWPTVMTMTSYTVMQFFDGLMVSRVGTLEFNAQNNGAMTTFVPISFFMGLVTLINTFASQNLGAGRPRESARYAWGGFWIAIGAWFLLLVYALFLPRLFALGDHSPELVALETMYGRIVLLGSVLVLASRGLSHFFYGMHRPKLIFVATLVGNSVNVFANWVLIFGKFGAPELGLLGAALGTIIGTAIELAIPAVVFLGPRMNAELGTRSVWRPRRDTILDLLRYGWPRGIQFSNEMACWMILLVFITGRYYSQEAMAAGWIGLRYMHLSFMPAVGISVAVTALVGRYIGAGQPDVAMHRAALGLRLAVGYMGLCAAAFVLFREPMVRLFLADAMEQTEAAGSDPDLILEIGGKVLICAAVFQIFDALAITMSGALNGAGDTIWPGIVTVVTSWVFIVGLGLAFAEFAPGLGPVGPWIGAATFIIVLGILLALRWRSGTWRRIDLLKRGRPLPSSLEDVDAELPMISPVDAEEIITAGPDAP